MPMLLQFLINGFINGLLYALVAMAFALTYNTTRIFHIAYAGVVVAGGYMLKMLLGVGAPAAIATTGAILLCGALNILLEKAMYQPMEKQRNSLNTVMVASIGGFIVLTNLTALLFGNENQVITHDISQSITIGSVIITNMQFWQLAIAAVLIAAMLTAIYKTPLGLNIRALSDDNELYAIVGNNAWRLRMLLFFISGAIAAVVSILLAYDVGFNPYFGMPLLLNALVAMIIGGFGSFKGALIGGILLGIVQSFAVYFFDSKWETAITFIVFIVVIIIRPQGLFGEKIRLV